MITDWINLGLKHLEEIVERIADQLPLTGPDVHPPELESEQPHAESKRWENGWWLHAKQVPSHPGRVGGPIKPFATVFHTTDMLPNTWEPLIKRMTTMRGSGGGYHFGIGRTPEQGVVQHAPITRNGNHAGGPGHGWFRTAEKTWHPNLVAVGIEVHNAGGLRLVNKQWRWGEKVNRVWTPMGPAFDPADVEVDPVHPLRGWHRFTDWQLEQLDALLDDLELVLAPLPEGCTAISAPEKAPAWADVKSARIVGHVDLDAANRSDPWPPGLRWLRERDARKAAEKLAAKTGATFEWRGKTRDR